MSKQEIEKTVRKLEERERKIPSFEAKWGKGIIVQDYIGSVIEDIEQGFGIKPDWDLFDDDSTQVFEDVLEGLKKAGYDFIYEEDYYGDIYAMVIVRKGEPLPSKQELEDYIRDDLLADVKFD